MSFTRRLILLFSALLLLSYTVVAFVVQRSTSRILEKQIRMRLEENAADTMQGIDRMLYERYLELRALATDPIITSGESTPERITKRLHGLRNGNPFYSGVAFFTLDRIRIADTRGLDIGQQHPRTEYWLELGAGKEFVLLIAHSSTTQAITLYAAHLVRDGSGRPAGAVVARMPLEVLHEIAEQHFLKGHDVTEKKMELLDKDGLVLYSSFDKGAILQRVSEDWPDVEKFIARNKAFGSDRHLWRKAEEISSYAQERGYREFRGNGWILVLCTPAETALAPVAGQRWLILRTLFTVSCAALLAIVLLAKRITRTLQSLSRQAREIGKGNLDATVEIASGDEIGELARSINAMAADLRAGEAKYRELAELLPQIVYETDAKGRVVFVNKRALSLFGFTEDDLHRGLDIAAAFVPEDAARLQENFKRTMSGELRDNVEYTARRKDGTTFPFVAYSVPIVREGAIVGLRGIGIDITERKRMETLVRIQRDLALALASISSLPDGLARCLEAAIRSSGMDSGGIYLVDAATGAFDLHSHRGVSREFVEHLSHLDANSQKARIIMAGRPIYFSQGDLHPATSETELLEHLRFLAVVPIGEPGQVLGCLNIASHVLDDAPVYAREALETIAAQTGAVIGRLQSAKALQESEQRYKDLAELLPQIVFETDADGNCTYLNRSAFEAAGVGPESLGRGFNPIQLLIPADRPRAIENLHKRLRGENVGGVEYTALRSDRGTYPILIFADAIVRDGAVVGLRGIAIDITERKRAEELTRELNDQLERKVAERTRQLLDAQEELVRKEKLAILGQLAGSVGHELRNPLGVMSNAIYYLKTVLGTADKTTGEYLDIIKSEIGTSERIIGDLLDFSRTVTPRTSVIAVPDLIQQALERCAIPPGVQVSRAIPDNLPRLAVDPLQINQVLQNLIVNAVQAMPRGGTLTMEAALLPEAGAVSIRVADTGEGIRPEHLDKLFQPLFTTKARGIGLGLAVSKQLVEANVGRIEVESRAGAGTTFRVILPVDHG